MPACGEAGLGGWGWHAARHGDMEMGEEGSDSQVSGFRGPGRPTSLPMVWLQKPIKFCFCLSWCEFSFTGKETWLNENVIDQRGERFTGVYCKKKGCNYSFIKEKQLLKDAVHNEHVRHSHCNFTLKFSSIALSTVYFLITCFHFCMFITAIL